MTEVIEQSVDLNKNSKGIILRQGGQLIELPSTA